MSYYSTIHTDYKLMSAVYTRNQVEFLYYVQYPFMILNNYFYILVATQRFYVLVGCGGVGWMDGREQIG